MTVSCSLCGEEWPRDPALEVPCPSCHARIAVKCRRPSGHNCDVHAERDRLAMALGFLKPCPGVTRLRGEVTSDDLPLFAYSDPTR